VQISVDANPVYNIAPSSFGTVLTGATLQPQTAPVACEHATTVTNHSRGKVGTVIIIIVHLLLLAPAGCSTTQDNGPWAMAEMVRIGDPLAK
jgi:hypothetical protein